MDFRFDAATEKLRDSLLTFMDGISRSPPSSAVSGRSGSPMARTRFTRTRWPGPN